MLNTKTFPRQQLPFFKKTEEWRKSNIDWADSVSSLSGTSSGLSLKNKTINYDLVAGKLHMEDLAMIVNPDRLDASYIPEDIQHMPIINSKLNVLSGEEFKRKSLPRMVVTNPDAITEVENNKKAELTKALEEWASAGDESEEDAQKSLDKIQDYYKYKWQDIREIRANYLLKHYWSELNFPVLFNKGFNNAMVVGEEIYACDIVGGEPTLEVIDPRNIRIFQNGYSTKVEDADMIVLYDYISPGKATDIYYDVLTKEDVKKINGDIQVLDIQDISGREQDTMVFVGEDGIQSSSASVIDSLDLFGSSSSFDFGNSLDFNGNIRRLRFFWKSRRMIKKVTSFDQETGEQIEGFYPENFKINKDLGESEEIFWINEAWEATKLGKDIYINMRPRQVQYNRLSNPSRCHFGITGRIYSMSGKRVFSMVDMMKPYNYYYNVIHDRLNKAIASNWGRILELDLSKVPNGWEIDKWLYYAKTSHIAVTDGFKEGNVGAARGKLSGMMNNNSRGVIDAETGQYIQQHIQLLEFIKGEMGEVCGITRQREGQTSTRETVGGIERSNLQSSHITEWLFITHGDAKKSAIECFIETAKIAAKDKKLKFQHILSDGTVRIVDIPGDEFAECDYGVVYDDSDSTSLYIDKINQLAQAAMQNQQISMSTVLKIFSDTSIQQIARRIEEDEKNIKDSIAKQQQEQIKVQQADIEARTKDLEADRALKREMNIRDNETKLMMRQLEFQFSDEESMTDKDKLDLEEKKRQFDKKLAVDKEKLELDKDKNKISREKIEADKEKARIATTKQNK